MRGRSREAGLVGLLVLVALALRLPTAGHQSLWLDEAYTARIVDGSLGHAWSTIRATENTPPLFYLVDWAWAHVVGTSELGLRSLSVLVGSLAVVPTVALARVIGRGGGVDDRAEAAPSQGPRAAGRAVPLGVALVAGGLLAVNPLAHWFSQEARAYALFLLLSAAAWVALAQVLERPDRRRLWLWALASVAVTWTHYFGGLLLLVGWVALVVVVRRRGGPRPLRPLLVPGLVSLVGVLVLAPIANDQRSTGMYNAIGEGGGLASRIVELPKQFAVGYSGPAEVVLGVLVALALLGLVVVAAWPRDGRPTRATALLGALLLVWVLPILGQAVGFDVVLTRNYVLLLPPILVLAALGAWRVGRRGFVVLGVVALAQLVTIVGVAVTPGYQRDDWRGALRAAERGVPTPQLLLISRYQKEVATLYSPTLRAVVDARQPVAVRSFVLLDRWDQEHAPPAVPTPPSPGPGFRLVRAERTAQYRLFVWEAATPQPLIPAVTQGLLPTVFRTQVLRP